MGDASCRFGPFTADRIRYQVLRDGKPLDLTPKLLDLLVHLLDHPATLVTKEALLNGYRFIAPVTRLDEAASGHTTAPHDAAEPDADDALGHVLREAPPGFAGWTHLQAYWE